MLANDNCIFLTDVKLEFYCDVDVDKIATI